MAVALRLNRQGTKDRPYYKIVAVDQRKRRDGRYIEQIGVYDPMTDGENFEIDLGAAERWLKVGARPSDTVRSMIRKARTKAETEGDAPVAEEAPAAAALAAAAAAETAAEPEAPAAEEEAPAVEETPVVEEAPEPVAEAPAAEEAPAEVEQAAPAAEEAPAEETPAEEPPAEETPPADEENKA